MGKSGFFCLVTTLATREIFGVYASWSGEGGVTSRDLGWVRRVRGGDGGVQMGTTILAMRYRDGVVVGADTRTSVSSYVSNRFASKLSFVLDAQADPFLQVEQPSSGEGNSSDLAANQTTAVSPKPSLGSTCCVCRSGSAADTQYLADAVRHHLWSRRILHGRRGSVSNAAKLLRSYMMKGGDDMSASLLCTGYDHVLQRGVIYSISRTGAVLEETNYAAAGSGSTYVLGLLDARQDEMKSWTEEEAVQFIYNAVQLAMERDGGSGGFVRLYVIDRTGKRSVLRHPQTSLSSSFKDIA